jgi:hypothetical protein
MSELSRYYQQQSMRHVGRVTSGLATTACNAIDSAVATAVNVWCWDWPATEVNQPGHWQPHQNIVTETDERSLCDAVIVEQRTRNLGLRSGFNGGATTRERDQHTWPRRRTLRRIGFNAPTRQIAAGVIALLQ